MLASGKQASSNSLTLKPDMSNSVSEHMSSLHEVGFTSHMHAMALGACAAHSI